MVHLPNSRNLQTKHKYSIEDDDNVKFSLLHIRKLKNTAEVEALAIDKTVLLIKAMIDKRKSYVSVRKV